MKFEKPALQTVEHIQLLRDRGLQITDPIGLQRTIDRVGFFRLLAYMIPFECDRETHRFQEGTTDALILLHYQFDRRLRFVMMEALEVIEVALKSVICNISAVSFGPHWYLNPDYFNHRDHHQRLLDYVAEACKESSEQFIKRYREEFHAPSLPPIWMVMELLTFGKLCSLYTNMKDSDAKKAIATSLGLPVSILSSWLLSLNYIRNCCAHHMRLWNEISITSNIMLVFWRSGCVAKSVRSAATNLICALPEAKILRIISWKLLKNYSFGIDGCPCARCCRAGNATDS